LPKQTKGLVTSAQSGFFSIETDDGTIVSKIPKRVRYQRRRAQQTEEEAVSSIVAVGDMVMVTLNRDGTGTIESVAPRESVLSRARPTAGTRTVEQDREQVLVANPDQVVFVIAAADPAPSFRKLDRLLVITEMNDLPTVICVNKIDLVDETEMTELFALYAALDYPILYTSAVTGRGIQELRSLLAGKLSVFSGSSGVGKSSLLNAVQSGLGLAVSAVSEATTKGMHTTRHTQLYKLDAGGYVADTPGIRGVALFDVEPSELDAYFREMEPLVADCQFSNCSHRHETGCAVRAAVADGRISAERYDSYLRLYEEHAQLHKNAY
jgi:ribosome biogenesis GTPase